MNFKMCNLDPPGNLTNPDIFPNHIGLRSFARFDLFSNHGINFLMSKLTAKQSRFIDAYLESWNATQAAKRAGYSEKTARAIGSENLRKTAIFIAMEKRAERRQAKIDRENLKILEEIRKVAFTPIEILAGDPEKLGWSKNQKLMSSYRRANNQKLRALKFYVSYMEKNYPGWFASQPADR